MQPRTIALLVSLLPIIAANLAYLISAFDGHVPWCIPYIDGCTTISRAARHGDAIYVFRALMMFYAVLLIWYWWVVKAWLTRLDNPSTHITSLIFSSVCLLPCALSFTSITLAHQALSIDLCDAMVLYYISASHPWLIC